jgi:zinc/manganese transport system permease protein
MFSPFMTDAWIAASIVAALAGVVGFFVVLRGSTFAAHALPLGAFPGAAAASLLGINVLFGLVLFAGLGVVGIDRLGRLERKEVATALSLVMLLGLGALFLSMTEEYSQGIYALLFGEVLGIAPGEILPLALIGAALIAATALLFRPLLLSAASPDLADAAGIPSRRIETLFLVVLALATCAALPLVGALLVFSLMVGPASAARALTDRPPRAIVLSVCLSLATVWAALALSYLTDWPVGFFVGAAGAILYAAGRICARARNSASAALAGG